MCTMNNTSLTADQIALNEYIAQENAAFDARMKAEGATWWSTYALTAVDLAEYGVFNIEQFKAHREENERLCAAKEERKNWYAGE